MTITVVSSGMLSSIQDLGRNGFQKHGVIVSGAMDTYSLRIANLIVGNKEGEAGLEITLLGPTLTFEKDALIAITGGDLSPEVEGEQVPLWRPVLVKKGSVLRFGKIKSGCRAYLTIAGGFAIPKVMNSKSTYLRAGLGGYHGRALKAGDRIETNSMSHYSSNLFYKLKKNQPSQPFITTSWYVDFHKFINFSNNNTVRVLKGSHFSKCSASSQTTFFTSTYIVTPQSDRMGYRLSGPKLELDVKFELLSEAVTVGTIQLPPNGQPIILMADRQTTGGYPKIAHVISVDLSLIGQMKPGGEICFQEIALEEAEALFIEREQWMVELKKSLQMKMN
ncbi:biotin-dependent carboxyltransferase family protein [Niallia hominis]|uniref:Biotin-dependent carboxyltransferase family protein n=1 Tax=Niallia hominis TaxID=3133173 RepID=A0ABV1F113_9BACI